MPELDLPSSLIPVGLRELAAYGALIWGFIAFFTTIALTGKPLWGIVGAGVFVVPYLAFTYPAAFGIIFPFLLWFIFWRWGWRTVLGLTLLGGFFVMHVWTRAQQVGWEYGLIFPAAIKDTGWLLVWFTLGIFLLRLLFGRNRLDWVGGSGYHGERRRLRDRNEVKRFKSWRTRKLDRAATQVKEGEKYQPTHASSRRRGRGGTTSSGSAAGQTTGRSYDPATGQEHDVRGWTPDQHPDPQVRQQYLDGGSGPINGWNFDQYSGLYLPHDPETAPGRQPVGYQLGGGIRRAPWWRRP